MTSQTNHRAHSHEGSSHGLKAEKVNEVGSTDDLPLKPLLKASFFSLSPSGAARSEKMQVCSDVQEWAVFCFPAVKEHADFQPSDSLKDCKASVIK